MFRPLGTQCNINLRRSRKAGFEYTSIFRIETLQRRNLGRSDAKLGRVIITSHQSLFENQFAAQLIAGGASPSDCHSSDRMLAGSSVS